MKCTFGNLWHILLRVIHVREIRKLSRGITRTPELKESSFGTLANGCIHIRWSMPEIFVHTYPGQIYRCSRKFARQTSVRYRKSWFSIIVKSRERNLDTIRLSFVKTVTRPLSGRLRSLCSTCTCMCVRLSYSCPTEIIRSSSKRLNCRRQSPKFFINWCQLYPRWGLVTGKSGGRDVSLAALVCACMYHRVPRSPLSR